MRSQERCSGPGQPCEEPGCPDSGALKAWRFARVEDLEAELDRLSRQVLEHFGPQHYEAALIRASAVAKKTPNDPRALTYQGLVDRILPPAEAAGE